MKRPSPSRLRVLLLNERCLANPLSGGAETHLLQIFGRLAEQGVHTELLCSGFPGQASPSDTQHGVTITRVGSRLSYYARIAGEVRRRIAAGSVDVIVEALNKIPFFTPLYAGSVPTLAIHHHLHGWTAFRQVSPPIALASLLLEQLVPLVYRRTPVLTISRSSKVELVRRGLPEAHIDVVPCGIDHRLHRPAELTGRQPLIVSVGRLEPYKRIDLAVRALVHVRKDVPDARLAIVGRGQEEGPLRALVQRLGLQRHVDFHGFVSEREKEALLQRAALLVQCSRKEGWGLTVIEAAACGTPAVAMAVAGLVDSVQDGLSGVLVHKPKPKILAAALSKLLLDEEKRVAMAQYGLSCTQRFAWDRAVHDVRHALRALVPHPASEPVAATVPAAAPARRTLTLP